jgi:hypothetical protein
VILNTTLVCPYLWHSLSNSLLESSFSGAASVDDRPASPPSPADARTHKRKGWKAAPWVNREWAGVFRRCRPFRRRVCREAKAQREGRPPRTRPDPVSGIPAAPPSMLV